MQTIKKAAQAVSQAIPAKPTSISLPKSNGNSITTANNQKTPRTPATPADEAIAFFSGAGESSDGKGKPLLQVWELSLEDDGGPSYEKSVS